jgi:hypothetical protein
MGENPIIRTAGEKDSWDKGGPLGPKMARSGFAPVISS